jgi:hypothetical protein
MEQVFYALRCWLLECNIKPDSLTVILNITDKNAAAHFDAEMSIE